MPHASRLVSRRPPGFSLVELVVGIGIVATLSAVAIPYLRAYTAEAQLLGAGRTFTGAFRRARSMAVKSNA